jgi:hypothetical protein
MFISPTYSSQKQMHGYIYWICQKQMHGWILDMSETDAWMDIAYVGDSWIIKYKNNAPNQQYPIINISLWNMQYHSIHLTSTYPIFNHRPTSDICNDQDSTSLWICQRQVNGWILDVSVRVLDILDACLWVDIGYASDKWMIGYWCQTDAAPDF